MKKLPFTLLLLALAPALPAQEEDVAPAPADEVAEEAPVAQEEPAVQEEEPAVQEEEPATQEEEPAVHEEPAVPEEAVTETQEEEAPAAPAPNKEVFEAGISLIRDLGGAISTAQNPATADDAAKAIQKHLDRLKEWRKEMDEALTVQGAEELYNADYRSTAEKFCLAISDLGIRLTSVHYFHSTALRDALLQLAKEMPSACVLRENTQWTCSGTLLLSMLEEALGDIVNETDAKGALPHVQALSEALQPWRKATRPDKGAAATRRFLKNRQSFIDQTDLLIRMQIKRIAYADYFRADELALPLLQATDSLSDICLLPKEERHIREGIVLLGVLENTLAQVKDTNSARAATAPITRLANELQQWGQGFNTMPEPDEETRGAYEKRYLPRIEQLNDRIKAQGERIASAEFYRCHELTSTLLHLILNFQ